jgi:Tol biopolymer transport system component
MNMFSGEKQLILSLKKISETHPSPTMEDAEHYVNHLAFNPAGNRFMFFHLWSKDGVRYNRLITCDIDGRNIFILNDDGLVSHYTWKSDTELLATVHRKGLNTGYYLFRDFSDDRIKIGDGLLTRDGHPSFSPDRSSILTDTYPDKYGEQHLFLYTQNDELIELSRFSSPVWLRGEARCDLHPRWDRNGEFICFDSADDGRRAIYLIGMDDLLKRETSAEL